MLSYTLYDLILWFGVYSFIGWLCELFYNILVNKEFADPGFLNLPVVPIYGFGGLLSVYAFSPWSSNPFLVFVLGMLGATVLEYFTSLALEKLFNKQLWSYASMPLNIDGRVCLHMSGLFGALALAVVYVFHPEIVSLLSTVDTGTKRLIAQGFLFVILVDFSLSLAATISLRSDISYKKTKMIVDRLAQLDARWDEMRHGHRVEQAHWLNRLINRINRGLLSRLGKSFPVLKQK